MWNTYNMGFNKALQLHLANRSNHPLDLHYLLIDLLNTLQVMILK